MWTRAAVAVLIAAIGLLSACSKTVSREMLAGPVELRPETATYYSLGAARVEHHVGIVLPAAVIRRTELDVLLLFDRTGSMGSVIRKVEETGQELVASIQKLAPQSRFAVASFADYVPLYSPHAGDTPWELVADFQTDPSAVKTAIASIRMGHGGDAPESYVRALWEAAQLEWREDAVRLVVLFGDSTHHEPDPGKDGILGTADDLTLQMALSELSRRNIRVAGIYCEQRSLGGWIGRLLGKMLGAGTDAELLYHGMWGEIAKRTGGLAVRLDDPEKVLPLILAAATQAILPMPVIRESDRAPGETRLVALERANPVNLSDIARPEFGLHVSIAYGTRPGAYVLPLVARVTIGREILEIPFSLRVVTGWINHPFLLIVPLLLTLLFLGAWLVWLFARSRIDVYYHVLGPGPRRRLRVPIPWGLLPWLIRLVLLLAIAGALIYAFDGPVLTQFVGWWT